MVICSSCDFENPGENRFCQQCGHPLQIWRAVFIPHRDAESGIEPGIRNPNLQPESFIDTVQKRYQLQSTPRQTAAGELMAQVIDYQPGKPSPIAPLQDLWLQNPDTDPKKAQLSLDIPVEALPYLALQATLYPSVPELHHAWKTSSHTILLLEDRTHWITLQSCWAKVSNPLRWVNWLYEMATLWKALTPWDCHGSLLRLDNLRVDIDHILCLETLSSLTSARVPELSELGLTIQDLTQSQPIPDALIELIDSLVANEIKEVNSLQGELICLAKGLQSLENESQHSLPITVDRSIALTSTHQEGALPNGKSSRANQQDSHHAPSPTEAASTPGLELPCDDDSEGLDQPTVALPMKLAQVDEAAQTYVGRQREHNEDCYCARTEMQKLDGPQGQVLKARGFYVLCDGMGGHASGEVASELAVKTLADYYFDCWRDDLPSEQSLVDGVIKANETIFARNQQDERLGSGRMGTTLVMMLLQDNQALVTHVGDSRLYTYGRRMGLIQVTVDHEVGQREIQQGVEPAIAYARPDAYQLTQALGPRSHKDLRPSTSKIDIVEDTLFILCSDGLSDNDLLEQYCSSHISPLLSSRASLEEGARNLIDLANEQNGHDNITVVLVRVKLRPILEKLPSQ